MSSSIRVVCLLWILLLGLSTQVNAQSSGWWPGCGTLAGVVADETDAALPDVDVVAMNADTGTKRETRSARDGSFVMPLLPTGSYVVTVERQGFAPLEVRNIDVHRNEYLRLHVRLKLGRLFQSVDVTATPPDGSGSAAYLLPALGQAQHGVRISGQLQRESALSPQRGYDDALLLVPGVISHAGGQHYVHGAGPESTVVLMDGAELSSARQTSSALVRVSEEALAEIEVKTAGQEASTPLTQGVVLNVVTRAGGNELHGAGAAVWQPRAWAEPTLGYDVENERWLLDAALGGPLRSDRWWAFGAYHWSRERSMAPQTDTTAALLRALVPGWTLPELTAGGPAWLGKVTGRLERHDVGGFVQRDVTRESLPLAGVYLRQRSGGDAVAAHWATAWSDRLMTRLAVSFNDKTLETEAVDPEATAIAIHDGVFVSRGRLQGTGALAYLNSYSGVSVLQPASKLTANAEATWYRPTRRGTHEVKMGLQLQPRLRLGITRLFPSHGVTLEEVVLRDPAQPQLGMLPFHRVEYEATSEDVQAVAGQDIAVHVQDSWRPTSRMTVSGGLRLDVVRDREQTTGEVTRQAIVIGPRVSASYAVPMGGLARGGWGRVHESAWAGRYSGPLSVVGWHDRYDMDLDGAFETDFYQPAAKLTSFERPQVDRTLPHVDEWTASYRQQLPGRTTAEVGLVRRTFRAMPIIYDDSAMYMDGVFTGYRDGPYWQRWVYTSNRWFSPVVTDLTLQAARQTARAHVLASYTRNWRHVSGTWLPNDPAAFLQPAAFDNAAGIGLTSETTLDSLSGSADTSGGAWVDHSLRVAGVYRGPRGLLLSGRYQLQSGVWSGPIVTRIAAPDLSHGPEIVIQDGISLSNPLATTVRFAYRTRGEGQLQLPAVHEISARVGYRFRAPKGMTIDTAIDVYNPLNQSTFITFAPTANQTYSPLFGQGLQRQTPRSFQMAVRIAF